MTESENKTSKVEHNDQAITGLSFQGAGIVLKQSFVSSPISPLTQIFIIITVSCIVLFYSIAWIVIVWVVFAVIFVGVYILAFFKFPEKLMSEKYNYYLQQLLLGDKNTGLKFQDQNKLYQPEPAMEGEKK